MTTYPLPRLVMGNRGVVTAGHYLATAAGYRIMQQGGNAIDAAAAMCFCLNLVDPGSNGIGGEVPTLIYSAADRKAYAVSGMGWSPESFTIDWCRENGVDLIPGDGYLPATVPAVVDTWALALARFGTLSFSQVLQPAIELAEGGFPVHAGLHSRIGVLQTKFIDEYPSSAEIYCPGGRVPEAGEVIRNPDFAKTLRTMAEAEENASAKGRVAGIEAARDAFYKGPIAERVADFISSNPVTDDTGVARKGLLAYDDMAEWHAAIEEPVTFNYRGFEVHKCPPWTQGPVFVQQLALLEGIGLAGLGHNSAEYLHTYIELAKLAFADREAYYGDPLFDDMHFDTLLSESYNASRRGLVGDQASPDLRPGDVGNGTPIHATFDVQRDNRRGMGLPEMASGARVASIPGHDTTHLDAIDRYGNMVAATPSGGWIPTSPVVKGLGFPMGTRGQMFYLNPERPNALAPHKRPRATLTPTLVTRNGEPHMVFGTPGGDSQDQWTAQFFLGYADFGMSIEEALDAPRVTIAHFPLSFYPRNAHPGTVRVPSRLPRPVVDDLERRGHVVQTTDEWTQGKVLAIRYDREKGSMHGAVSPGDTIGSAIGW